MFDIGDKVVYPMHGAGVITSVENKHVNNKDSKYLIVQMVVGSMIIMIPETNVEHVGLREIISKDILRVIEEILQNKELTKEPMVNWNKRSNLYIEQIKSGDIYQVATVVNILIQKERHKKISTGERRILNTGRQILLSELSLVCKRDYHDMQEWLDKISS